VRETGTVTFFLYFDDREHAEHAHAALTVDGFACHHVDPPEDARDTTWSVLAEREMHDAEVEGFLERVRAIAQGSGGHVDGIATPWPGHPHESAPRGSGQASAEA
jgi:hypothetical protein